MAQHVAQPKLEANLARLDPGQRRRAQPVPPALGGQAWKGQEPLADGPRIAFIVTTSDPLEQIRVWISYHRAVGVTTFYIFADGQVGRGAAFGWVPSKCLREERGPHDAPTLGLRSPPACRFA